MTEVMEQGPRAMVKRLTEAVNAHDLEALTSCFSLDYRNETPAHPARGFQGRSQVRRNWDQIFAAVPDITAEVRSIADEDTVWSEWDDAELDEHGQLVDQAPVLGQAPVDDPPDVDLGPVGPLAGGRDAHELRRVRAQTAQPAPLSSEYLQDI